MKKIVVLAIVGALVLVLLLSVGIGAQGAPPQGKQGNPQEQPVLLTIIEDHTLAPSGQEGDVYQSEWLDVGSFRLFRLYARMPYDVSVTPGAIRVHTNESPLGDVSYDTISPDCDWDERGSSTNRRWVATSNFSGLYSKMSVYAENAGDTQVTISLYLLMAQE
jgi:hypothetical protein